MYKKQMLNGICINPITKETPFINEGKNRFERRKQKQRMFNNSSSTSNIVTRIGTTKKGHGIFVRYTKSLQKVKNRIIVHFKEK